MRQQALIEAKQLLANAKVAVLSTHSHTLPGFPFGSTVQFFANTQGQVYLFISDIAQHAKNLTHDNKLSLTVFEQQDSEDPQMSRLTLVAEATKFERDDSEDLIDQFVEHFPSSEQYKDLTDFHIWELNMVRARFIAGFGKIFWLEMDEWITE
ncbi:MAG: pyridoxamine 5'-phosphate oxidase family protein [Pseudomonadota bacterium]